MPWWGLLAAALAPILLVGGWTVAAHLQPGSFDPVSQTISALAAYSATDRWVMTGALMAVGCCDFLAGLAIRIAALPGRLLLMSGGVFGFLVALSPQTLAGPSLRHQIAAGLGCAVMTAWPVAARRREPWAPFGLQPLVAGCATAVLLGVVVWFCAELLLGGAQVGLAERTLTGAQTFWPLIVAVTVVLPGRRRPQPQRQPDLVR